MEDFEKKVQEFALDMVKIGIMMVLGILYRIIMIAGIICASILGVRLVSDGYPAYVSLGWYVAAIFGMTALYREFRIAELEKQRDELLGQQSDNQSEDPDKES